VSGENKTTTAEDMRRDIPPSLARNGKKPPEGPSWWLSTLLPLSLFLIGAVTTGGGLWLFRSHASSSLAPAAFVAGPFFLISAVAVQLGVARERRLEKAEDMACEEDCLDLYWALNCIEDRTLKGLAWVNYKQLRNFIIIAQRQARMSFYASLVAAAISLLVLTSIASVAVGLPTTAAKVIAGLLATVGSVLSGFLTKTFLRSYQMASHQMSYYYGQPLVHCYLLLAEWLASEGRKEFGKEEGRLLLRKVIDASIKAAADAEDHLLTIQEHDSDRRTTGSVRRRGTPRRHRAPQSPPGSRVGRREEPVHAVRGYGLHSRPGPVGR
jgi:hypothetical protein